nr:putative capsid protein [Picobirnavirus sp.]
MTSNAIKAQELKETKRHNRRQEEVDLRNANTREAEAEEKHREGYSKRFHRGMADFFTGLQGSAKAVNDFSWYAKFETTLRNALKQPITDVVGSSKSGDISGEGEFLNNVPNNIRMHKNMISSFYFIPTIGASDDADSAICIATRDFNTKVRGANAGATNYDAADLMMLPLASDSIITMLAWLRKTLSIINLMDSANPVLNLQLLLDQQCYGITALAADIKINYPAYVAIYNEAVDKINNSRLPSEMPYIKRHAFITNTLFFDGDGVGIHYYNVLPEVYFTYDETNSKLTHNNVDANLSISPDYQSNVRRIFNQMLTPLLNSQTVNTMCGDMEKANIKFLRLENLSVDQIYKLRPVVNCDPKYLQSFKNADIVNLSDFNEVDIRQATDPDNNPFLYQGNYAGNTWSGMSIANNDPYSYNPDNETVDNDVDVSQFLGDRLVDYYDSNKISDEDQLYNLSFKVGSNTPEKVDICRSELIYKLVVCQFIVGQSVASQQTYYSNILSNSDLTSDMVGISTIEDACDHANSIVETFCYLYDEDFLPKFWLIVPRVDASGSQNAWYLIWKRNHNRNFVTKEVIQRIHKYCLQSLFMLPQ